MRITSTILGDNELRERGLLRPVQHLIGLLEEGAEAAGMPTMLLNITVGLERHEEHRREDYGLPSYVDYVLLDKDGKPVGSPKRRALLYVEPTSSHGAVRVPDNSSDRLNEYHGDVYSVVRKLGSEIFGALSSVPA